MEPGDALDRELIVERAEELGLWLAGLTMSSHTAEALERELGGIIRNDPGAYINGQRPLAGLTPADFVAELLLTGGGAVGRVRGIGLEALAELRALAEPPRPESTWRPSGDTPRRRVRRAPAVAARAPEPVAEVAVAEPRRRGRPARSKDAPAAALAPVEVPPVALEPEAAEAAAPEPEAAEAAAPEPEAAAPRRRSRPAKPKPPEPGPAAPEAVAPEPEAAAPEPAAAAPEPEPAAPEAAVPEPEAAPRRRGRPAKPKPEMPEPEAAAPEPEAAAAELAATPKAAPEPEAAAPRRRGRPAKQKPEMPEPAAPAAIPAEPEPEVAPAAIEVAAPELEPDGPEVAVAGSAVAEPQAAPRRRGRPAKSGAAAPVAPATAAAPEAVPAPAPAPGDALLDQLGRLWPDLHPQARRAVLLYAGTLLIEGPFEAPGSSANS